MMPRGFKPVGWAAAVGGAALGCYMLSLNVAAERADLVKIEREIVLAKQEIRSLQTELGTRGRLQQLEHWNADVLALSAPTNAQFLDDAVTLARFETHERSFEERAKVQLASAEAAKPAPRIEAQPEAVPARKLPPVQYAVATERPLPQSPSLVRQASYTPGEAKVVLASAKVEPKAALKAAPKKAEAKAEPKKGSSLKTVVAKLDDDKPAETARGAKAEAGLR